MSILFSFRNLLKNKQIKLTWSKSGGFLVDLKHKKPEYGAHIFRVIPIAGSEVAHVYRKYPA
jgi:hypothetical protein